VRVWPSRNGGFECIWGCRRGGGGGIASLGPGSRVAAGNQTRCGCIPLAWLGRKTETKYTLSS
jgi:hypothetical protein